MTRDPSPLRDERQRLIGQRLSRDGRVLAADLAAEWAVSEDTVRRDLREMAAAGLCRRVYGGALPLSPASAPLRERSGEGQARKAALAVTAAGLVAPGQTVLIDAGSTNAAIAAALPQDRGLTVVTNAPLVAAAVAGHDGIELVVIGGRIDRHSGGSIGAAAIREVGRLRADLCFVGACALDPEGDVAVFGYEEVEFKQAMIGASASVAIALTTEKIGTRAPYPLIPTTRVDALVIEADAPPLFEEAPGSLPVIHRAAP